MFEEKSQQTSVPSSGPNGTPFTGVFVLEPGTGYGFVIRPGEEKGYFLSQRTLKSSNSEDTRRMNIRDLDRRHVSCHLRPSAHPKHEGRLEAYQVSLLQDTHAIS